MSIATDKRWSRFVSLLALVFVGAGVGVLWVGSQRPLIANQSLDSLGLAGFAFASALALQSFRRPTQRAKFYHFLAAYRTAAPPSCGPLTFTIVVGMAVAFYLSVGSWLADANQTPADDQGHYLAVAQNITERWGPGGFARAVLTGEFREDNRHPLYLQILAYRPEFEFGKRVSLVFGGLVIVVASLGASAIWGRWVGAASAVALACNRALLEAGALVACETMLTLCVTLAGLAFVAAGPFVGAFLVGVFLGLAYLAKASGWMLLVATLLGALVTPASVWPASRARRVAWMALVVAGFILSAFPLLWRNTIVFGAPLHSFNTKLVFANSYEEGECREPIGLLAGAKQYMAEKGLAAGLARMGKGLVIEAFVLTRSLGAWPMDSLRSAMGVVVVLLVVGHGWSRPHVFTFVIGSWVAIFSVFFAWYVPIATSDRFVAPLAPMVIVLACESLGRALPAAIVVKPWRRAS